VRRVHRQIRIHILGKAIEMRIPIREQLAGVVLLTSSVPLAVLAIATWVNNHNFVTGITSQSLQLAASLKATQIASDILLIQSTCATIVTRILLQGALKSYYKGNQSSSNWDNAAQDVRGALASGGFSSLLQ
jgi:osomolarity two-component system sensor histidine kinase SLN1